MEESESVAPITHYFVIRCVKTKDKSRSIDYPPQNTRTLIKLLTYWVGIDGVLLSLENIVRHTTRNFDSATQLMYSHTFGNHNLLFRLVTLVKFIANCVHCTKHSMLTYILSESFLIEKSKVTTRKWNVSQAQKLLTIQICKKNTMKSVKTTTETVAKGNFFLVRI